MARQLSVIDDTKVPPAAPPAPPVPGERTVRIPVSGMTCAACQARVQRTLQRQPGVVDAGVNLMMHDATVRYTPDVVSPEQLVAAIRDTGYGAELPPAVEDAFAEQEARDRSQAEEFAQLKRKAIVSGVIGALAMVAPMALMPIVPHGVVNGVLLALTVSVMLWAGRHFYTRAWAAFRHHSADMNTLIAVGTGAAFVYSLIATLAPGFFLSRGVAPDVYYEAVIVIIALILTGNAFEARAKAATSAALRALAGLQPTSARVVRGDQELDVPMADVRRGDVIVVRPGERLPTDGEVLAAGQMQRDVAAIVDIGAIELGCAQHGDENFFCDGTGHRRHRRDEMIGGIGRDCRVHAAGNHPFQAALRRIGGPTQRRQLFAEFIEQAGKTPRCGVIGRANLRRLPFGLNDQINWTVLQMQPLAVRKKR